MDKAIKLGSIVALQVQRDRIKIKGVGYYPHLIQRVDEAVFSGGGMIGRHDDGWLVDVHHPFHPNSKRKAGNRAVSFGFTSHYAAMRERFGEVADFVAGENVIVDTPDIVRLEDLAYGIVIKTATGIIEMGEAAVAEPCREFTSHLLGLAQPAERRDIEHDIAFLTRGTRGFVAGIDGGPFEVEAGDEVWTKLP